MYLHIVIKTSDEKFVSIGRYIFLVKENKVSFLFEAYIEYTMYVYVADISSFIGNSEKNIWPVLLRYILTNNTILSYMNVRMLF